MDAFAIVFEFGRRIGGRQGVHQACGQGFERVVTGLSRADGFFVRSRLGVDLGESGPALGQQVFERSDLEMRVGGVELRAVAGTDGDHLFEVCHITGMAGF